VLARRRSRGATVSQMRRAGPVDDARTLSQLRVRPKTLDGDRELACGLVRPTNGPWDHM
jgi:hypothetical protein